MKYETVAPCLRARLDERAPHFIAGLFVGVLLGVVFVMAVLP